MKMNRKLYRKAFMLFLGISMLTSCSDYLDVVPDMDATLDMAFSNRTNAERYLFGCYNFMPDMTSIPNTPGIVGGDETYWNILISGGGGGYPEQWTTAQIAKGFQTTNSPLANFWDGENAGRNLFVALRDCNTFLENIHLPPDMISENERTRWAAEVKFLKAYYHFFLLQLYGPIPIIRENLPVNASPEEVRIYREPVDDVVNYIVELLDEAMKDLPLILENSIEEKGRATQPIALSLKAKALVLAASPLFNGNKEYQNFVDNKGRHLISITKDITKWRRAAEAIKNAIDTCHLAGHQLHYYYPQPLATLSEEYRMKYNLRYAVVDRLSTEVIWPSPHNTTTLQKFCIPKLVAGFIDQLGDLGATLKMAEQFYSNNGIPISEDPEWMAAYGGYAARYETQPATGEIGLAHNQYIHYEATNLANCTTAKLNFYREPRFYAYLCFDRGVYEGSGRADNNSYWLAARCEEGAGFNTIQSFIPSGYFIKKLVPPAATKSTATSFTSERYSFPLIRISDLYLLYAEALNELNPVPPDDVYEWIDRVRARTGLKGVKESWTKSTNPTKASTQEGMREIIKGERLIELCFEGHRFFDLLRWKDARKYFSEPTQGWDFRGKTIEDYYRVTTYYNNRTFNERDYLWPIKVNTLIINGNLVQNPGWK